MHKFPKLKYPSHGSTDGLENDDVVVTEKLDGANFRFTVRDDGSIVFGSRNVVFVEDGEPLPIEQVNKSFRHAARYVEDTLDDDDRDLLADTTLYGEAMHLHSLEYENIEYEQPDYGGAPHPTNVPNVVIFDVRDGDGDWKSWDGVTSIVGETDLRLVRELERGDPDELSFDVPDESMFGGHPEGIVARRLDGVVRAKKVTDDFKETNAVSFNDTSKAQSDAAEFVAMYVTPARIEKQAHKLVDEGTYESLEMKMMQDLPRVVIEDVFAENGWDLITNDFECEFDSDFKGEVRSKVSKSCARELKSLCNSF